MQEVAEGRDAEGGNQSRRSSSEGKEEMNPGEVLYQEQDALSETCSSVYFKEPQLLLPSVASEISCVCIQKSRTPVTLRTPGVTNAEARFASNAFFLPCCTF